MTARLPVTNAPERIYLQIGDELPHDVEIDFRTLEEVTWCQDNIHGTDLAYVRVDLFEALQRKLDMLVARERMKATDPWHEAVLNACMVRESCYVEADPAKTVQQLLQWESQAAIYDAQASAPAALMTKVTHEHWQLPPDSECDPGDLCAGCRCKYNTYGDGEAS